MRSSRLAGLAGVAALLAAGLAGLALRRRARGPGHRPAADRAHAAADPAHQPMTGLGLTGRHRRARRRPLGAVVPPGTVEGGA